MSEKQPEALRLADLLEIPHGTPSAEQLMGAAAELRRLHAECEALRADAERYRWLRDEECAIDTFTVAYWNAETAEEIDAAIDAARAAKEQP